MQTNLPFARAYDCIIQDENLLPAEKIILLEVCRYWPKSYNHPNAVIAENTGFKRRWIQTILKALSTGPTKRKAQGKTERRAYIKREYVQIKHEGKLHTVRAI
ncbi:unnamed protein product, partial [marine sediment metagenome]